MIDVQAKPLGGPCQLQSFKVSGPAGTGQVFLQGAQIAGWTPNGTAPVFWLGPRNRFLQSDPIRGGIPICLPWFGGRAAPRHGFARLLPWQLTDIGQGPDHSRLAFSLDYQPTGTAPAWPCPFQAQLQMTFAETLSMTLHVTHLGEEPAHYEPALHPYFRVGDISRVRISGLGSAPFTDHGITPGTEPSVAFGEHGIDRVYQCSETLTIHDDANNRDIVVQAPGARNRIIWNPGAVGSRSIPDLGDDDWHSFLCVEPGNVQENAIRLAPGQQHSFTTEISVIPQT